MVGYTALSDDYIKKIAIITQSTAKLLIFFLLIVSLAKKGERERERERESSLLKIELVVLACRVLLRFGDANYGTLQ
jgi:hypothetical protein